MHASPAGIESFELAKGENKVSDSATASTREKAGLSVVGRLLPIWIILAWWLLQAVI